MGIVDYYMSLLHGRKAIASTVPYPRWTEPSITMSDEMSTGRYTDAAAFIPRVRQHVLTYVQLNARQCAANQLRLYTTAKGRSKSKSKISRKRMRWLKGDTPHAITRKSAGYAERAGDIEEVMDHPVLDLLARPNPMLRGASFWQFCFAQWEMTGKRFILVEDDMSGLYPMQAQHVRIVASREDFIAGYIYGRDGTIEDEFSADEVLYHTLMPSPFNPLEGIGPLHAAFVEADIYAEATQSELAMWQNGARPDFALSVPESTTADEVKAIDARFNQRHKGSKNRGRFWITSLTGVEPLQFSPREMEYLAGKEDLRASIREAFGIPESLAKLNDANLASSLTGHRQYQALTILPRLCMDAEEWTETLLPRFDVEPGEMWFAYDNPVAEDREAIRADAQVYVPAGVLTVNEVRAELGYEPVEWGDEPRSSAATEPIQTIDIPDELGGSDDAADAEPAEVAAAPTEDVAATALNGAQVQALSDLAAQVATGQLPVGTAIAIAQAAFPLVPQDTLDSIFNPLRSFNPAQEAPTPSPKASKVLAAARKHRRWIETKDDGLRPTSSAKLQDVAEEWFRSIRTRLKVDADGNVDVTPYLDDLERALAPAIESMFRGGLAYGYDEVGAASDPDLSAAAREALSKYTVRLAREIGAETNAILTSQIADGLEAGESINDISARVADSLDEQAGYRAERIARTETTRAFTAGQHSAWRESGISRRKWLLSPNACPQCEGFAKQFNAAQSLDEPYLKVGDTFTDSEGKTHTVGYADVNGPPLHPGCRCTEEVVFDDE